MIGETIAHIGHQRDRDKNPTIRVSYPDGKRAAFSPDDPLVVQLLELLEKIRVEHGTSNWSRSNG